MLHKKEQFTGEWEWEEDTYSQQRKTNDTKQIVERPSYTEWNHAQLHVDVEKSIDNNSTDLHSKGIREIK